MEFLHVSNAQSLTLGGSLGGDELDLSYSGNQLSGFEFHLFADHDSTRVDAIRIGLSDFTDGTDTWTMSATHQGQAWTTGSGLVYFKFTIWMTDYVDVSVKATNTSTQAAKTKLLRIKTQPRGSLPGTLQDFGGGGQAAS